MTAQEFAVAADALGRALRGSGMVIERAIIVGGNVRRWQPIDAEAILGRWLQNGWRVRFAHECASADDSIPPRVLSLQRPETDDGA